MAALQERVDDAEELDAEEAALLSSIQDVIARLRDARDGEGAKESATDGGPAATTTTLTGSPASGSAGTGAPGASSSRLLVVANRLPISVSQDAATGEYSFKMSSGGLVSALVSVRSQIDFVWMGWLGKEIPVKDQPTITARLMKEYACVPVYLSDALIERYYTGFSNDVLWPLLHYEHLMGGTKPFDFGLFDAYLEANALFADAVLAIAKPADLIWLHDYHLMMMPAMLRAKLPTSTIAWFLHTPWPSSEVYRTLPVREAILSSLLTCDLLGFHTYDYHRHFLSSANRILQGAEVTPSSIAYCGRLTKAAVFPIGMEPESFVSVVRSPACQKRISELCGQFAGKRIIVAVDRLDPIKGVPHRLLGLATFFKKYPEWVGKVVFIQVAVPSRTDVEAYRRLTAQVNTLVGSINAAHGDLSYQPIQYFYRSVDPTELCALYTIADVALITSLRDGMNLVSEEYIACQGEPCALRDAPGAVVLSEFAGCAQSLAGALRVNPWSADDIAEGVREALVMSVANRRARWETLNRYVTKFTSRHWAAAFVAAMHTAGARSQALRDVRDGLRDAADRSEQSNIKTTYGAARRRAIVLRYDGALELDASAAASAAALLSPTSTVPSEERGTDASAALSTTTAREAGRSVPADGLAAPPSFSVAYVIHELCKDPANTVVLVSSHPRGTLEAWFADVPRLRIIAEDGMMVRVPKQQTAGAPAPSGAPVLPVGGALDALTEGAYPATYHGGTSMRSRTALSHVFPTLADRILADASTGRRNATPRTPVHPVRVRRALGQASGIPLAAAAAPHAARGDVVSPPVVPSTSGAADTAAPLQWIAVDAGITGASAILPGAGAASSTDDDGVVAAPAWKDLVLPILRAYVDETPGSFFTETENTLTWHFHDVEADLAAWQAKQLQARLDSMLSTAPLDLVVLRHRIQIRHSGGSIPRALRHAVTRTDAKGDGEPGFDFVLALGDTYDVAALCSTDVLAMVPHAHDASVIACQILPEDVLPAPSSGATHRITSHIAARALLRSLCG